MITPKLIHPMLITIEKIDISATDFDNGFRTLKRGSTRAGAKVEFKGDKVVIQAQLKNNIYAMLVKISSGWINVASMNFVVYAKDVLDNEGVFKLKKGDRIIKIQDQKKIMNHDLLKIGTALYIEDFQPIGVYDKAHFIRIIVKSRDIAT